MSTDDAFDRRTLGIPVEVCIATRSLQRTIEELSRMGVGPWRVYRFDAATVADRRSFGEPDPYEIDVAFAEHGPLIWEVMQPLRGARALADALDGKEAAWHHIAFDRSPRPFAARLEHLRGLGAKPVLSGVWLGRVPFEFFSLPAMPSVVLEAYAFPVGFEYPDPVRWYPDREAVGVTGEPMPSA